MGSAFKDIHHTRRGIAVKLVQNKNCIDVSTYFRNSGLLQTYAIVNVGCNIDGFGPGEAPAESVSNWLIFSTMVLFSCQFYNKRPFRDRNILFLNYCVCRGFELSVDAWSNRIFSISDNQRVLCNVHLFISEATAHTLC